MKKKIKIICCDIDNTICLTKKNYYKSSRPNLPAITKINYLYSKGYYIKLFTSRFMGRNKDNVTKAKRDGYKFTESQLKKWKVNYNELIFGKPSYDLFIDDKCIFFKKNWYNYILKKL